MTNGDAAAQVATFDRVGLRGHVDGLVVSGAVGLRKPDSRIFALAAAEAVRALD